MRTIRSGPRSSTCIRASCSSTKAGSSKPDASAWPRSSSSKPPVSAREAALSQLLLARIALRLDDAAEARRRCDAALAKLADVGSPILTYHARLLLGHALARGGDSAGAYASYQIARDALETLRSRLNGEELKIAFVKNKGEVYERLVQLCLEGQEGTGGFEQAFTLVEQAKSRTLFDLMFQPVHALAREEGSESQLAHAIRELREELNWYYHLVELEQLRPGDQLR